MAQKFIIKGGNRLKGTIRITGSKNATLPIMVASLLTDEPSILTNVPDISDMHSMRELLTFLGAKTDYENHTLTIYPPSFFTTHILQQDTVKKMRASILLLPLLLAKKKKAAMIFPGGCVLGKRSIRTHLEAFKQLDCEIVESEETIVIDAARIKTGSVILNEFSVTASENILITAATLPGATTLYLAAIEPHVQDLCHFLQKMGVAIHGIGTHTLTIIGRKRLQGVRHKVVGDYLQAGTFAIAGAITQGEVKINGIDPHQLDLFLQKLSEAEVEIRRGENSFTVVASSKLLSVSEIKTNIYPGFPTDLQAPFAVLMTQAHGKTHIFETLFEERLNYLAELEKIGAKIEMINPHQAIICGDSSLNGVAIESSDIRSGAAMVIAALVAKGTTQISNIAYIDRGYEKLDEKLRMLGADIQRVTF